MELLLADEDQPPPIPKDFGFNLPEDYVFDRGSLFVNYGIMPRAGGFDDQDPAWTDDLKVWLALRARIIWERRRDRAARGSGENGGAWTGDDDDSPTEFKPIMEM